MLLENKTAVITGCARGIGREILRTFAENGANVFACVRKETEEFSERIKDLSEKNGVEIIPLYFDLRDEVAMKNAVMQIRKSKKKIDILVNNAGIISESLLFQMTPIENMREVFEVNFFAQIRLTQYISRLIQKNENGGSIVFMSSIAAFDGTPGQLEYIGSKAAIAGITKALSYEFGPLNIRVNAVAPGPTKTDMGNEISEELAEDAIKRSALGRWGTPEEVANVVLFLASDLSNYVTGQCIRVDGGGYVGARIGGGGYKKLKEFYALRDFAKKIRLSAIKIGYAAGKKGAHFGGGLSSVEILACLYGGIMNVDPHNPTREDRDIFIAGKAHCVLSLYPALAYSGFFPVERLEEFEKDASEFGGHPTMNVALGIEFSGGSLGMGLSQGVGVALGFRRKNLDNHVFVLIGDGECNEGSVWEAAMSAAHFQLDHLIVIVDKNGLQYDGETSAVMDLQNLSAKFCSFGFDTYETDGHDVIALCDAFEDALRKKNGRPKAIVAKTVKGKGVSFMENRAEWHHGILSQKNYELAIAELTGGDVPE